MYWVTGATVQGAPSALDFIVKRFFLLRNYLKLVILML